MPEVRAFPSIPTKILLPIDFSPSSQAALEMASDLAQHFHAELFLLNVIPMFPTTSLPDLIPEADFIQQARNTRSGISRSTKLFLRPRESRQVRASKSVMILQETSCKLLNASILIWS
jgi:nucleotide-binding universal stress UspA family protein